MDDNKIRKSDFLEGIFGGLMDLLPVVCAVLIVLTAGTAYREGYRLFVQEGLDKPGEAHSEMVSITEEDASSALAVGRLLLQKPEPDPHEGQVYLYKCFFRTCYVFCHCYCAVIG